MADQAAVATSALVLDGRHLTLVGAASRPARAIVLTPDSGAPVVHAVRDLWPAEDRTEFAATVDLTSLVIAGARTIRVAVRTDDGDDALRAAPDAATTPNDDLMDPNPVNPTLGVHIRPETSPDGSLGLTVHPLRLTWGVTGAHIVDDELVVEGEISSAATVGTRAVWLQAGDEERLPAVVEVEGQRWRAVFSVPLIAAASSARRTERVVWTVTTGDTLASPGEALRPFPGPVRCRSVAHVKPRWAIAHDGGSLRFTLRYTARSHLVVGVQNRDLGGDE